MCPEVPPFSAPAAAAAGRHGYWALRNYLSDYLAGEHYTPQATLWWAKWLWGSGHADAARRELAPLVNDPQVGEQARALLQRWPAPPLAGPPPPRHRARSATLDCFTPILVRCPRCHRPGQVRGGQGRYGTESRFACGRCGLAVTGWQGPGSLVGKRRCGQCRAWLEASQPVTGRQASRRLPVRCDNCRWEGDVVAEFLPGDPFHHDPPLDYVFGLPLWLATPTRHGWLWALNGDHLAELRAYVGAQERSQPPGHLQWASRLPAWIKAAKHRAEILRALDKLVQQLQPGTKIQESPR